MTENREIHSVVWILLALPRGELKQSEVEIVHNSKDVDGSEVNRSSVRSTSLNFARLDR